MIWIIKVWLWYLKEDIPFSIVSNRFYLECYISYGNIWDLHHRVGWLAHCEYVHGICIHCCLTFIEKNSGSRSVQQLNNGDKSFLKLNCRIFKVTVPWKFAVNLYMNKRPYGTWMNYTGGPPLVQSPLLRFPLVRILELTSVT